MLNPVDISTLQNQVDARKDRFSDLKLYREYVNGEQTARLNDNQLALFPDNKDPEHVVNVLPNVLKAKCDRLRVTGFKVSVPDDILQRLTAGQAENPDDNEAVEGQSDQQDLGEDLSQKIWRWWMNSGMDSGQKDLHHTASRDGDAFLIADYDPEDQMPRLTFNLSYDGESGCDIFYENDNPRHPLRAIKHWNVLKRGKTTKRLNIYYKDRIEKYVNILGSGTYSDAGWVPYTGDGDSVVTLTQDGETYEAAVVFLTDQRVLLVNGDETPALNPEGKQLTRLGSGGKSLGMLVIHFANNAQGTAYGRSDLADVVPAVCDQLNDASVDLRIATKFSGSPINVIAGQFVLPDSYNSMPGALLRLVSSGNGTITFGQLAASNLTQLIETKDSILRDISTITGTPLPMINPTAQVAAEGTLQQQETPLITRVEDAQDAWGNKYEDAVRMLLVLEWVFGSELTGWTLDDIRALSIDCIWKPAQIRNEANEATRAQTWREAGMAEEIIQRHVLNIPPDLIEENKRIKGEAAKIEEMKTLNQVLGDLASSLSEGTNGNRQGESTESNPAITGIQSIAAGESQTSDIPSGVAATVGQAQ